MTFFDRKIFFDAVRKPLFSNRLTQQQVDGMEAILGDWEDKYSDLDLRWLAYPLATAKHETASTMSPIEEFGKGKGMAYGKADPETGQTYYGRGFVQLTWRDNYRRATQRLGLAGGDDLEWHTARALDLGIAADVMFRGMVEGWFRSPNRLATYFSAARNDPFEAREIINGDKNIVPSWAGGKKIGTLIASYHNDFLAALQASAITRVEEPPVVMTPDGEAVRVSIQAPEGVEVIVAVNGREFLG